MAAADSASEKAPGTWTQVSAALVLVGMLAGGFWLLVKTSAAESTAARVPATCSTEAPSKAPPKSDKGAAHASGARLCEALNRTDLAALLGTPDEIPKSANGSDGSFGLPGAKFARPSAEVEFDTYTVSVAATYDGTPVGGSGTYLPSALEQKFLGRPAYLYSDRTISIALRLDGRDAGTGPGVPVRALTVAADTEDSGGSFDVALWRADGRMPDDAVLLRVAEKVLPTLKAWGAGT
ncbi:DUF6215 domain-containing protein [Streptomyces sp. NBC_00525]|uniref:DUF6215 domain-containing protein n=1 Tax=Streptomyces sp. NBC_00525 TaxID=2903660 RepID=UPI002E810E56|nr:DUF6215 domain-containing protein [Streptomyces sp. NBC_00525]WUC97468.1 DUF6215 domain-containing protein [Streptomyces sp. NBC_00525]